MIFIYFVIFFFKKKDQVWLKDNVVMGQNPPLYSRQEILHAI
jgi:hypothetical protein